MDRRLAKDADISGFPFGEVQCVESFAEEADGVVAGDGLIESRSEEGDLIAIQRGSCPVSHCKASMLERAFKRGIGEHAIAVPHKSTGPTGEREQEIAAA